MASGTLPAPGTTLGPCAGACVHTDCAATRAQAETKCGYCWEPIGYDRPFYLDDDSPTGHAHGLCVEMAAACGSDKLAKAIREAIGYANTADEADPGNVFVWTPAMSDARGYGRNPAVWIGVSGVDCFAMDNTVHMDYACQTYPLYVDLPAGWELQQYSATIITFHRAAPSPR